MASVEAKKSYLDCEYPGKDPKDQQKSWSMCWEAPYSATADEKKAPKMLLHLSDLLSNWNKVGAFTIKCEHTPALPIPESSRQF